MVAIDPQQVQSTGIVQAEFQSLGSALFQLNVQNVNPLQMLALANYLEITARRALLQQIEGQSIAIARPNMPEGM